MFFIAHLQLNVPVKKIFNMEVFLTHTVVDCVLIHCVIVDLKQWNSKSVAVTSPGELQCRYIFHIAAEMGIEIGMKACLEEADRRQLSSITFPVLGTGVCC